VLVVLLSLASRVFMPRYARVNLEQFGPLGVVFAIASWLVVFGGAELAAVVRRIPGVEAQASTTGRVPPGRAVGPGQTNAAVTA
jgi:hypothetical protein